MNRPFTRVVTDVASIWMEESGEGESSFLDDEDFFDNHEDFADDPELMAKVEGKLQKNENCVTYEREKGTLVQLNSILPRCLRGNQWICPPGRYSMARTLIFTCLLTYYIFAVYSQENGLEPWKDMLRPTKSHFESAHWDNNLYQTCALFAASILGDVFVIYFHVFVEWPHPKFRMRLPRQISITTHILSGVSEIACGVAAFFVEKPIPLVYAMCALGMFGHVTSSLYQTPQVFGAKRVMIPAYLFCIATHAFCLCRLLAEPGDLSWLIRAFGVLHIYVWCRIFFILFYWFEMFGSNLYTAAILAAGLIMLPVLGASMNLIAVAFICLWNILLEIPILRFDLVWWTKEYTMTNDITTEVALMMRMQQSARGVSPNEMARKTVEVGEIVSARYQGGWIVMSGKVTAVNGDGTYCIQFDSGDVDPAVPFSHVKKATSIWAENDLKLALQSFIKYAKYPDVIPEGWMEVDASYTTGRVFAPIGTYAYTRTPPWLTINMEETVEMLLDLNVKPNRIAVFLRFVDSASGSKQKRYKPNIEWLEFYRSFWHADSVWSTLEETIMEEARHYLFQMNSVCTQKMCICQSYVDNYVDDKCVDCLHARKKHSGARDEPTCFGKKAPRNEWDAAKMLPDKVKAVIAFRSIDVNMNNSISGHELYALLSNWGVEAGEAQKLMEVYGTHFKKEGDQITAVIKGDFCKPDPWSPMNTENLDALPHIQTAYKNGMANVRRLETKQPEFHEKLVKILKTWYRYTDYEGGEVRSNVLITNKRKYLLTQIDKFIADINKLEGEDSFPVIVNGLTSLKNIGFTPTIDQSHYGPMEFAVLPEDYSTFEKNFKPVWEFIFDRFVGEKARNARMSMREDASSVRELREIGVAEEEIKFAFPKDPLEQATCAQKWCGCCPCCPIVRYDLAEAIGVNTRPMSLGESSTDPDTESGEISEEETDDEDEPSSK